MSGILVYAEQRQNTLKKVALESISQGRRMADELDLDLAVLLVGYNVSGLIDKARNCGADIIYLADSREYLLYNTEIHAAFLVSLIKKLNPQVVLMGHTAIGKDLAPRAAEQVDAGMASDCVSISISDHELFYTRPIYAGKAFAEIVIETPVHVVTLRPNIFPIKETPCEAELIEWSPDVVEARATVEKVELLDSNRPDLAEADIIISGGRGLGGPKGFGLLEQFASILGAAVGASRTAVDSGWIPHSFQIGQTGKVVNPSLYIACGISGAVQHIAGMGSSKFIVAINKDPDAHIFQIADFGIVADLYEAIPELINQLEKVQKANTE